MMINRIRKVILLIFIIVSCSRSNEFIDLEESIYFDEIEYLEQQYILIDKYWGNDLYVIEIIKENVVFKYDDITFTGSFYSSVDKNQQIIDYIHISVSNNVLNEFKNKYRFTYNFKNKSLFYKDKNGIILSIFENKNMIVFRYEKNSY